MCYTLGTMRSIIGYTLVQSFVAPNTTDCNTLKRTLTYSNEIKSSTTFSIPAKNMGHSTKYLYFKWKTQRFKGDLLSTPELTFKLIPFG
jgi:hypothetical protein